MSQEQIFENLTDWIQPEDEAEVNIGPKAIYEVNDTRNQINLWTPQFAPVCDEDNRPGHRLPPPVQLPQNDAAASISAAIRQAGMKPRKVPEGQSREVLFVPQLESPYLPDQHYLQYDEQAGGIGRPGAVADVPD